MLVLFTLGIIIPAAVGGRDDGNRFIPVHDGVCRLILHGQGRAYGGENEKKKKSKRREKKDKAKDRDSPSHMSRGDRAASVGVFAEFV